MKVEKAQLERSTWTKTLSWEGETVLNVTIARPHLTEDRRSLKRIDGYYRRLADTCRGRWEGVLYREAVAALEDAHAASRPFAPFCGVLDYAVTRNEGGILSLYCICTERRGGRHPGEHRTAVTWDLSAGAPLPLKHFLPKTRFWRQSLLDALSGLAAAELATGESLLDTAERSRLAEHFSKERFYLTDGGVTVFYPLYVLAPYAEGVPTFAVTEG